MSTQPIDYHLHNSGDVVRGEALRCIDPSAGAVDVVVLTPEAVLHIKAEAVREARDEIKAMLDGFSQRGRHTRARWAVEWLGHIANRNEQEGSR